ncbi:MAG: 4-hydroxy-tetrahydrodipicolinate synthase [Bacteroidia bacterium]|jgi:4-hydroxy-tetrahydrodipicolinate synthase|nr:4-hydroxy-tetrahydrodipicolinate synthase [Bacteroidia bacterium]
MKGTGVALITPFKKDFSIDFDALDKIIDHSITGGVEYLVALGTTGESVTLTKEEKSAVYSFIKERAKGKVACVAGLGGNNTQELIDSMKSFDYSGFDAILSVSPYYNKPSQEGIFQHYMAIQEHAQLPIIIYNVPGRTGSNMTAATTLRLANASEKFAAIKEASGNPEQFMDLMNEKPADFDIISGDDNLTLPFIAMGMSGVISVIGQAYPQKFSSMVRLGLDGKFEEARQIHYNLYNMMKGIFIEGNPGGVKYVMSKMGLCENVVRLPLATVSKSTEEKLDLFMKTI